MIAVQFHPDARAELLDAATYYEEQADGLGGQFIDAVQRVTETLAATLGLGTPVAPGSGGGRCAGFRTP